MRKRTHVTPRPRSACVALVTALVAVVSVTAASEPTRAERARADAKLAAAARLKRQKRLSEACALLDESYALDPRTPTLLDIAECRLADGDASEAWRLHKQALDRAVRKKQGKLAAQARKRIAQLEKARVRLRFELEAVPDGLELKLDGRAIPSSGEGVEPSLIDAGAHSVSADAPGRVAWTLDFDAAEGTERVIRVPALLPSPVGPAADAAPGGGAATAPVADRASPSPVSATSPPPPPWLFVAATNVVLDYEDRSGRRGDIYALVLGARVKVTSSAHLLARGTAIAGWPPAGEDTILVANPVVGGELGFELGRGLSLLAREEVGIPVGQGGGSDATPTELGLRGVASVYDFPTFNVNHISLRTTGELTYTKGPLKVTAASSIAPQFLVRGRQLDPDTFKLPTLSRLIVSYGVLPFLDVIATGFYFRHLVETAAVAKDASAVDVAAVRAGVLVKPTRSLRVQAGYWRLLDPPFVRIQLQFFELGVIKQF